MSRSVVAFVLTCAAISGSVAACGAVEESPAVQRVADAGPPPPQPEGGTAVDDAGPPPLRDVLAAIVVDLGDVASGQDVTLDVPQNALGFNILVESRSVDGIGDIGIQRITSPSGEVVHDAFTPKGGSHATSGSSWGSMASASVPQSESKAANLPEPGKWTVRFGVPGMPMPPPPDGGGEADAGGADDGGLGPANFRAEARIQMGSPAGFIGGRLDVNVYVPTGLRLGGATLDAATATTNEGIARRFEVFFDALSSQVGIDRGELTFHAVRNELTLVDNMELLVDAFAASAGRPQNQALHVMLTNAIDFGGGNAAWGIAPGIPGAAMRTGTSMSGIVIAIGDTPAVGDGLTMLHEAGHFLGLNHTTEFSDGLADPLSDTPKCETISLDDPTSLGSCADRMNIMFPAFYGTAGAQAQVSDAQRAVYRGSPIYKAYKSPIKATMSRARTLAIRSGERVSLTKSGRALTPIETWLSASLCSRGKLEPSVLRAYGSAKAIAALQAAAADPDLPDLVHRRATGVLRAIGAEKDP